MRRYEDNKQKNTKNFNDRDKRVRGTIIHPKIERHIDDIYIEVRDGDRLDTYAYAYYKDVSLWWIIAAANHKGKGTLYVRPGKKIRIPHPDRLSNITQTLDESFDERF